MKPEPAFAVECALLALQGIVEGWGYEIGQRDLLDAIDHALTASTALSSEQHTRTRISAMAGGNGRIAKLQGDALPFSALAQLKPMA